MMFSKLSIKTLSKALLFKNSPVYVQFYVTARCNLTCEQCNIIYANSDLKECTIDDIEVIAENFAKMGVAIVLLTGGEPFVRKDIHKIIYAFESRGVHVRMQTNGLANEEQVAKVVEAGGRDISISLDTLKPSLQDEINGGFSKSWHRALKAISLFTKYLPKDDSFSSLGCVLQPRNINDVKKVIKFGTSISWFTSLVPAHVTDYLHPRGFRTFDQSLKFKELNYRDVDLVLDEIKKMKKENYLLYDSDQYLNDIKKFIRGEPVTWRQKNNNTCDSPNLYFAVLPNGDFAPCCDYRLTHNYPTYNRKFPDIYKNINWRNEVNNVVRKCDGCMYGSYPEITISFRYFMASIQRIGNFITKPPTKTKWPLEYDELLHIARDIESNKEMSMYA